MAFCFSTVYESDPAFQALIDGLRDQSGIDAEMEGSRDYLEYGYARTPEEVIKKLNSQPFSPLRDKSEEPPVHEELSSVISKEILLDSEAIAHDTLNGKVLPNTYVVKVVESSSRITKDEQRYAIAKRLIDKVNSKYGVPGLPIAYIDKSSGQVKIVIRMHKEHLTAFDRKLDKMPFPEQMPYRERGDTELSSFETKTNYSQEIIRKMAEALGEQTGVDFAFISGADAVDITKNSTNPWKGQKSFFFGGKVYFIAGSITPDDVLHEYVHPIMRSIAKQNPALFKNLYGKAQMSVEGQAIIEEVSELYPNLDQNSDDFKEEVLVRSLAKIQDLNNKGLDKTSEFQKFVDNLLYAIKQYLRTIFGQKIGVATLDQDTTLRQLSDMLEQGGKFELDPDIISEGDLVAYKNEYNEYMREFNAENVDAKQIEEMTNNYFEAVKKHLRNLMDQNDLGSLVDIMQDRYKQGELQKMVANLKPYQSIIQSDARKFESDIEATEGRVNAMINSLGNVDSMVKKLAQNLKELVKDVSSQDNVQRVLYTQKVLKYWADFAKKTRTGLEIQGVSNLKMVDSVIANADRADAILEDFYQKVSRGILWDVLKPTAENIDQRWQQRIKELEAKGDIAQAEAAKRQYENEKITPEQIQKALDGSLKDLNFANAYLEGASYSPDPVIGGVALFTKNKFAEVEVIAQKNFNETAKTLKPLLNKLDKDTFNPNKPGLLGEKIGQKEKVGKVNAATGEFEEREIWRYMNQFTGADLARSQYEFKLKQAANKFAETGTEDDRKILAALQTEWEQHKRKYFHQEYTEPFYKAYDLLKNDEIGQLAKAKSNELYDKMNVLSADLQYASADDVISILDSIDQVRRELKQLSSLYDITGNMKEGEDLEIAMRLQTFNEAVKDMYTSEEIPGAFEKAYQTYEQKLIDEGKPRGSVAFDEQMEKWRQKNVRPVLKDEFWDEISDIQERIKEITSNIPNQDIYNQEIENAYATLRNLVKGNRDESGQPVGDEMTPEKQSRIKEAMEIIEKAMENMNTQSGLSKLEQDEVDRIIDKITATGGKITQQESLTLSRLMDKKNALKLDNTQRAELKSLYNELAELRGKVATESYIDAVNNMFSVMDQEALDKIIKGREISVDTAGLLANDEIVEALFLLSPEFKEWFERNHMIKESIDRETGDLVTSWARTYAWSVIKPRDEYYYETTEVTNGAGEKIKLKGLPTMKFFKRVVKDEFLTKKVVGETVDNRGYWLPKTLAQGAADDRYINKEYEQLRQRDPNLFAVLEKMKELHLKNQDGLGKKEKLWLDMPRFRKQTVERLQSENPVKRVIQRVKDFWTNVKDGWEHGFNPEADNNLVKMDLFDDETSRIPIAGLYDLDIEEVSTDILYTSMRYMLAAERNKALTSAAPVVKMIQNVVNNPKNYPDEVKMMENHSLYFPGKKKKKYLRARAINNYVEKTFEGQVNTGFGADNAVAQNFSNFIFKRASTAYLGFNIPSAVKNALGMKFQSLIESTAGTHLTFKNFISSEAEASAAMFKVMGEVYKGEPKSLDLQKIDIFDPERDRFSQSFGEAFTRTPGKDYSYLFLDRLNDFRKITQLQASTQTLFGMMKSFIIPGTNIRYFDAWEVVDGKIQLKAGIDPTWGITYDQEGNQIVGEKFKQKRNEFQRVLDNLNGSFAKDDRPEADRYLAFRYISFFRRYLTSMLMNRLGYSGSLLKGTSRGRYDYVMGDTKEGFYVTFLKLVGNSFRYKFQNIPTMEPKEKAAAMRVFSEIGTLMLMKYVMMPLILGYDDEDEDRFEKLRARSGPLPMWGVVDDPEHPFSFGGWMANHAILQTMQVMNENNQFIPFPGLGWNSYKQMLDVKSMAFGPTIKTGFDVVTDVYNLATGDDHAYYQKEANAYEWAQEGDWKLWNHIGKALGFTAGTVDPVKALKNTESFQGR